MSLPLAPNTTCDMYRSGNVPPAAPDVASVPCYLKPAFARGMEAGEGEALSTFRFSHILLVDVNVDVRDGYSVGSIGTYDTVYIPDQNGTAYRVRFVERWQRGTGADHKRVYLAREAVSWPSTNF